MEKETKVLSPLKSVRAYCLECRLNNPKEVRLCSAKDCSLHPYRSCKGNLSVRTIKRYCMQCGEPSIFAVQKCEFNGTKGQKLCPLYIYRLGKNPNRKGRNVHPNAIAALSKYRQQHPRVPVNYNLQ